MRCNEAATYDIVIAGLGPVGAVAANLAGRMGFRTLVVERGLEPYRLPRAIVFDAEIMRIFASIGLADRIAAVTKPLGGSVYLGADRQPIRTFRAPSRAHPLAWHPSNLFYQPQLEALLREGLDRFSNVTVLSGHEVTAVAQEDGCTRLSISDGTEVTASWILACDGASSTIRKALDIRLDDIGFEERWLVVDTFVNGPMRWPGDHAIPSEVREGRFSLMVCDPGRPATLIPGSGRHRRWEYMLLDGERDEDVVGEAWLRERLATWIDPADVEIVRAAVYRFRALVAEQWRRQAIFLVGDAAHQTPPFYGQGMCHGIRDAAQLLWKIALVHRGLARPALLDGYQMEREGHVRAIISASVAAGAAVCTLDPVEALARDAAFRAEENARRREVAMTDIVPPIRNGLVDPATGGMRLPEFVVRRGEELLHIDTVLADRFTLLSRDPLVGAQGPEWMSIGGQSIAIGGGVIRDADDRLEQWLADQQAQWVIVRPDRYVFASGIDQSALTTALESLFTKLDVIRNKGAAHVALS